MEMSNFVVFIITMIGLAVGIDYSLFIVQRFREERGRGREKVDAIATAGATASRTVFFSGMAVAIALAGMLIMPDATFQSFAVGAILVVAATVLAAMTLLPAVLGLLGDRVNWLHAAVHRPPRSDGSDGGSGTGSRRPSRPSRSSASSSRAACSSPPRVPVLGINLGSVGISSLPEDSNSRHAFDVINERVLGRRADGGHRHRRRRTSTTRPCRRRSQQLTAVARGRRVLRHGDGSRRMRPATWRC